MNASSWNRPAEGYVPAKVEPELTTLNHIFHGPWQFTSPHRMRPRPPPLDLTSLRHELHDVCSSSSTVCLSEDRLDGQVAPCPDRTRSSACTPSGWTWPAARCALRSPRACLVLSGPVWSCVVLCGPVWSSEDPRTRAHHSQQRIRRMGSRVQR